MTNTHSRIARGGIEAYDVAAGRDPVAFFPLPEAAASDGHAVAPTLDRAVHTGPDHVVCVDRDGKVLWRTGFGHAEFSADGRVVWLYQPGDGDRWVVLDAASGVERAGVDLTSEGVAGVHFVHPDGRHVLLSVGEGQDGVQVYLGSFDGTAILHTAYPWHDRVVLGFSPGGGEFLSVAHDQTDLEIHRFPTGDVITRATVEDLGYDNEMCFDWTGAFLDADRVVVAVIGDDWSRHAVIDAHTARWLAELPTTGDIVTPGDGTWWTTDPPTRCR
ncbi:hypothetical protein [Actinosynnema sp. NPDC020468]|uniref:hypothetical protein n=1 Tax=Actinosynnema sp. NPDC020468 TaxID=3154488 RepID=UPI0033DDA637